MWAIEADPKDEIIEQITMVRARNNGLWMGLLELALNVAPKEAKSILKEINKNDKEISKCLRKLQR
jgi:hypothetical protein